MAVKNCCDVNVIFSLNLEDQFKAKVDSYLGTIKNEPFISLRTVRETFFATFSNRIKEIGDIVVSAVNETREELERRDKRLSPASSMIEEVNFKKALSSKLQSNHYFKDNSKAEKYMTLLFKKIPTFGDLKDPTKLQEFWENSLKNADYITVDAWDKFRKKFSDFKEAPRFDNEKQAAWEKKVKELKTKENIFTDVDNEDIFIATEYLTYVHERGFGLQFSGFDRGLIESLNKVKEKLSLNYPSAVCLIGE